jgi:hypothetical protein
MGTRGRLLSRTHSLRRPVEIGVPVRGHCTNMSATCDPLVRGQTSAGQSPARICVAYNITLGTLVCPEYGHDPPREISR